MTKQSSTGVVVKAANKDSKKDKPVGNGKQKPTKQPANNAMISTWSELRGMTIGEFEKSLDRLDLDKLVDYKADTYYVKADKVKKEHPKEALFIPLVVKDGDKTHKFVGQTDAVAVSRFSYAKPIESILWHIAYLKGNPYI